MTAVRENKVGVYYQVKVPSVVRDPTRPDKIIFEVRSFLPPCAQRRP
jgi:hypothetical protein